jgi:apolipoprotein N-acyltransferase
MRACRPQHLPAGRGPTRGGATIVLRPSARLSAAGSPAQPPIAGRGGILLAAAGGGVLVFAFPPYGLWPLAPVAVALLSLSLVGRSGRAGCGYGMVFGLAFFFPLLWWLGTYVGPVAYILAPVEAAYLALMGGALAVVQRLRWGPLWVAALWVAQEALRGRAPFGGFPWGRLAFSQPTGAFLPFAAFGGAPLVTFAVALSGALLARAVERTLVARSAANGAVAGSPGRLLRWPAALVAGAVLAPLAGLAAGLAVSSGSSSPTVVIAAIQGNVPRLGLDYNSQREAVLRNHVDATLDLARRIKAGNAPQPAFVVWPEDSSDINPLTDPQAASLIDAAAKAIGAPILIGTILPGSGNHIRNVGMVWDPTTGPGATYTKRHPVPFGEYIPLRSIARFFTDKVDLVPNDMVSGDEVGALDIGGVRIGDVICFEIAYDSLVTSNVRAGAQVLITQTNNATFGRTGESSQQLAMARLRAVEHNRSNLVVSTSGISAYIAPDGSVQAQSGIFTQAVFDAPVPLQSGQTVATRLGAVPEWVITAVGVAVFSAGTVLGRRSSERAGAVLRPDDSSGDPAAESIEPEAEEQGERV